MSTDPSSTGLAVPLVEALKAARSPSFMPALLAKHLPHHNYTLETLPTSKDVRDMLACPLNTCRATSHSKCVTKQPEHPKHAFLATKHSTGRGSCAHV